MGVLVRLNQRRSSVEVWRLMAKAVALDGDGECSATAGRRLFAATIEDKFLCPDGGSLQGGTRLRTNEVRTQRTEGWVLGETTGVLSASRHERREWRDADNTTKEKPSPIPTDAGVITTEPSNV